MPTYSWLETVLFPQVRVKEQKLLQHLSGKTIIITGASSGIGEALAVRLSNMPVRLVLIARREQKLIELKNSIAAKGKAQVSVYAADLRQAEEMEALLSWLKALPGGIDIIVSNAGKSIKRSIFSSLDRYHDFTRTMAINYLAPVQLLLALIPILEQRKGQIINVSTINMLMQPFPHWSAYQASKSAFDQWLRAAAPELRTRGVKVTTFYLPLVRTPMIEPTAAYKSMPAMSPEHVAAHIGKAMYTHKRVFKPWWIWPARVAVFFYAPRLGGWHQDG
ncbi:SDR family NAD(P)-dependent oxidoreductase [Paenibacillus sp. GCM10027626]|uniref:SDR family NAD(P)-dependent oxidoreductase n=1 Tax=Paenibacillus sp. GCM10027626 TaxID=3273411 RepID=UPI003645005B